MEDTGSEWFNLLKGEHRSGFEMIRIALRAGQWTLTERFNLLSGLEVSGYERKLTGVDLEMM